MSSWSWMESWSSYLAPIIATLITVFASVISIQAGRSIPRPRSALDVFVLIVVTFGLVSIVYYWDSIKSQGEDLFFAVWLAITMIAGMFVAVLAKNYRSGRPLFDVPRDELLFPLLFSFVVFYPIWTLAASSPRNLFVFYAAFLNGYFWENVVTNLKPPSNLNEEKPKAGG